MHHEVETANNFKKACKKVKLEMSVLRKNIH